MLAAVLLAALGFAYRHSSRPDLLDGGVAGVLRRAWPRPGPLFYVVDGLVALAPVLLVIGLLVAACLLLGLRRLALVALLGPFCVAGATSVLKPLVGRTIHGDNLSFPSGHTGYATAVGLVLGLLLVGVADRATTAWRAVLLLAPALVAGGVMAFDQTTMEAHYLTDTLGGACTALVVVLALALLLDRVLDRVLERRTHREGSIPDVR